MYFAGRHEAKLGYKTEVMHAYRMLILAEPVSFCTCSCVCVCTICVHVAMYLSFPPSPTPVREQNKNSEFCAPLTSFDWNETDPNILGASSIDTTCTIWGLEVGTISFHASAIPIPYHCCSVSYWDVYDCGLFRVGGHMMCSRAASIRGNTVLSMSLQREGHFVVHHICTVAVD